MSTKGRDESGRWGGGVIRMEVPSHNVGHQFRKCMSVCRKRGRDWGRTDCVRLINGIIKTIYAALKGCYKSQTEEPREGCARNPQMHAFVPVSVCSPTSCCSPKRLHPQPNAGSTCLELSGCWMWAELADQTAMTCRKNFSYPAACPPAERTLWIPHT